MGLADSIVFGRCTVQDFDAETHAGGKNPLYNHVAWQIKKRGRGNHNEEFDDSAALRVDF